MYIPKFWAGVLITILVEIIGLIVWGFWLNHKHK